MRSRFMNGMLIGGLMGMLAAVYYSPKMKRKPQRFFIKQTKRLGQRTGKMVSDMAREVQDFIRR